MAKRAKQTKGLVLVSSMRDLTRTQFETFIQGAQARRLAAAVVYFETKTSKLSKVSEHFQVRIEKERDMLAKMMNKIEWDLEKMQLRVEKLHQLEHEAGIVDDRLDELKQATEE